MQSSLRFDFHVHSMLSKSIPFSLSDLDLMISQAKKRHLDGFALTEHIHAPGYWDTYRQVKGSFVYRRGVYRVNRDFHILNGAEINLGSGGHLIVIGEMDAIQDLDERLDLTEGNRPTLAEVLEIADTSLIFHGAHPFRPEGGIIKSPDYLLKQLCALELNGKDADMEKIVRTAASELGMSLIGGSDAHLWPQVGISITTLPKETVSISSLKKMVTSGLTKAALHPDSSRIADMCSRHKRAMKERMLGKKPTVPVKLYKNKGIQLSFV